jgi:hypothetical protein
MTETLTIRSERVEDIPLLLAQLDRMGVQPLLDEHFSTHGNWVGLSLGGVTGLWLTHILSEAEHRLNHVEPWAEQRLSVAGLYCPLVTGNNAQASSGMLTNRRQ